MNQVTNLDSRLVILVDSVEKGKTCNLCIYADETWQALVIKPYENSNEHLYSVKFTYKNGVSGTKMIRFTGDTVNIKHTGGGKRIKVKNTVKNTILEFERQYRFKLDNK